MHLPDCYHKYKVDVKMNMKNLASYIKDKFVLHYCMYVNKY